MEASSGRCSCACPCCDLAPHRRSVKRKLDPNVNGDDFATTTMARVEVETEVAALREALASHQDSIRDLCAELDEERNASASAANETMSMILRLQREKAEALMEARQFKRFAEEKMAHDQRELGDLDELLFKRDQDIQSLSCELQACRHRLLSYGIELPSQIETPTPGDIQFDIPLYDYPPLRCDAEDDYGTDLEKYAFEPEETPDVREELENLEQRIHQLETTTPTGSLVMDKGVLAGESSHEPIHLSTSSGESSYSELAKEFGEDKVPVMVGYETEDGGGDDASDRVYTIDAVHGVPVVEDDFIIRSRENAERKDVVGKGGEIEEGDIKKLYSRLHALEADRESMKQAIISMRTEKAQLVLLREIAQQLCKEVKPERPVVKKPSFGASFSNLAVIKWIVTILFWRRKASQSKYTFGLSKNNAGLLLLLDKSPRASQWRCLSRTRGG